jgi:uncharacterized phage infection (PIP) family protein YhgE
MELQDKKRKPCTTLHLVLLCGILITGSGLVACRSGGIRVRSWSEAIRFTQRELEAAGDLAGRLERYAETAHRLNAKIELLDQARPALVLIDRLSELKIPLIGNGWQILLLLLSVATVDGAKIIAKLEEVLRDLTELKVDLDALQGLPAVADSVRGFQTNPNRRTLEKLAQTSAEATPALRQVEADLGKVLDPLQDVTDNISSLVNGLRSAGQAGVPVVSDVARTAAERIGPIEEPLSTLNDGLHELHQEIGADAKVLERIEEAARQAREHEGKE